MGSGNLFLPGVSAPSAADVMAANRDRSLTAAQIRSDDRRTEVAARGAEISAKRLELDTRSQRITELDNVRQLLPIASKARQKINLKYVAALDILDEEEMATLAARSDPAELDAALTNARKAVMKSGQAFVDGKGSPEGNLRGTTTALNGLALALEQMMGVDSDERSAVINRFKEAGEAGQIADKSALDLAASQKEENIKTAGANARDEYSHGNKLERLRETQKGRLFQQAFNRATHDPTEDAVKPTAESIRSTYDELRDALDYSDDSPESLAFYRAEKRYGEKVERGENPTVALDLVNIGGGYGDLAAADFYSRPVLEIAEEILEKWNKAGANIDPSTPEGADRQRGLIAELKRARGL